MPNAKDLLMIRCPTLEYKVEMVVQSFLGGGGVVRIMEVCVTNIWVLD